MPFKWQAVRVSIYMLTSGWCFANSYGFVPTREPPILSAVDLPEGFGDVQHPLQAFPRTPVVEPGYGESPKT